MCVAAAVLTAASGLFGAYSSIQQGNAQAAAYEAQANAANQNAKIAAWQAEDTLKRGAGEEKKLRERGGQFAATQLSQLAASGQQLSGSALGVLQDTGMGLEQDADTLRLDFAKEKWGHDVQQVNYLNEADGARSSAKNAKKAGRIGAFTSLLGAGVGIYSGLTAGASTGAKVSGGTITLGTPVPTPYGTKIYKPGQSLPMY